MPNTQSPLRYATPTILWQAILRELQGQVSKVTYDTWLAGSTVLADASTASALIVVVCNVYAARWLTYRLYPVVARTAVAVVGKPIFICFIPKVVVHNVDCDSNRSLSAPMCLI
jgi:chromosomal replication initiation ATPase DnaA